MAEQKRKNQASKAASAAKGKKSGSKSGKKGKKSESLFSPRFIGAAVSAAVFILLLVLVLQPQGALTTLISNVLQGLVGRIGFLVAIPAALYLFIILAFSGKRPVRLRTVCVIAFAFFCGAVGQLALNPDPKSLGSGVGVIGALYQGGAVGNTGGVLCGGLALGLQWLCGTVLAYIILILLAVLTLLGAMQITIPSIIRAIRNRPRAEWEDEEDDEDLLDPAEVVVNHIAARRIEYVQQRRERQAQQVQQAQQPAPPAPPAPKKEQPKAKPAERRPLDAKASEMLRQIDADVESPVAAAAVRVTASQENENELLSPAVTEEKPVPEPVLEPLETEEEPEQEYPEEMPPFDIDAPIPPAPVLEKPAVPETPAPAAPKQVKVTVKDTKAAAAQVSQEIAQQAEEQKPEYKFPSIELLKAPVEGAADGTAEMRENSRRLNETLASFKIEAHIINVTRGPSVTRYEVELEKGVRLNKLTSAADDIALNLGASGVRIAAVPGKISVVGIEVPNQTVTTVTLREVIASQEFARAKSKATFAVGKDIGGSCIVGNIAKLPHMLIAGTTGSGKSVCMNSIIISLLYKASPEDVRLIMVDPKMVELGIYNGIPHLLIPVVTDPKKAAGSLQWAVTEMMRRYRAMSDAGVRDLDSYNSIIESQEMEGEKLPKVVVIIDELADLMLVAAKEVEESICRIAQMGRAAGIHLIIATQRPSADVITGLMKANIPSRIAFAVASAMESRIILDTQGAEKLVGKGDMLFAPIGNGKPRRVQGCFVSDQEVEAVAEFVKANYVTDYNQDVMDEIEKKAAQTGGKNTAQEPEPTEEELSGDEMLPAAVDVILETGQASVSMLQRRLKLGYARAARIVDEMEEKGIVGPFQGSKPRAILVTKEQWAAMRGGRADTLPPAEDFSEEE